MWEGLSSLEELEIDRNNISDIRPDMWGGLGSLRELDLENNGIKTLQSGAFNSLQNLNSLNLEDNSMTEFTEDVLNLTKAMNGQGTLKLVVRGNPFHCDEKLCWLKDAQAQGRVQFYLAKYGKVNCANYPGVGFDDTKLGCDIEKAACQKFCEAFCKSQSVSECLSDCLPACKDELESLNYI